MRNGGFKSVGLRAATVMMMAGTALGLPIVSTAAYAQERGATVLFHIPAQDLGEAVAEFGRQSRVQVTAGTGLLAGRKSSSVSGRLPPLEALSQLLNGTGLIWRWIDRNTVALEAAPQSADGSIQLGPVRVDGGDGARSASGSSITSDLDATEGTHSYTTRVMTAATKLRLTQKETPQAVTVITRQRMDDQALLTFDDIIDATPGLSLVKDGSPARTGFYARGFAIENVSFDGVLSSNSGYLESPPDLVMYDRIEVVRGATGLVQGAGQPSATINLVRKRPTRDQQLIVSASAARWSEYSGMVDASSPVNEGGSIRARFVASYRDMGSFRTGENSDNLSLYGIGEIDLGANTTVAFGASVVENNNHVGFDGLPIRTTGGTVLHWPRSTSLVHDWERWDKKTDTLFADINHSFGGDWEMRVAASRSWSYLDFAGAYWNPRTDGTFDQGYQLIHYDYKQYAIDAFLRGSYRLLGGTHELVIGGGTREARRDGVGGYGNLSIFYSVDDLRAWDSGAIGLPTAQGTFAFGETVRQHAAYLTNRVSLLDGVRLIAGGRLDWYRTQDLYSTGRFKADAHLTKYAGIVWDVDHQHALYASYTDIFSPQTSVDRNGRTIDPVVGKNYEIGVKGEYLSGALNASLAMFSTDQANRARLVEDVSECTTSAQCYEPSGLVRSKGFEAEINGALAAGWEIGAGYTYNDAKYLKDDRYAKGTPFSPLTPRHLAKLTTSYVIPRTGEGARLGGGLRWQSRIYSSSLTLEQKSYFLVDLNGSVKLRDHIDVSLNLSNLFDKTYFESVSGLLFGEPRKVRATLRWTL